MDVYEELNNVLDDLGEDELEKFKVCLHRPGQLSFEVMGKGKVQRANTIPKMVDLMVETFEEEKTLAITIEILRAIKQNQLAKKLEAKFGEKTAAPALAGAPAVNFFKKHRYTLETRLGDLRPLLLSLQSRQVLTDAEREVVDSKSTKSDRNQALLSTVLNKGTRAQDQFYLALKEADPYLVSDLEES